MAGVNEGRALPRDRALLVYWRGETVTGLLLYGLRSPGARPRVEIDDIWPEGAKCSPPWLLHGETWAVDVWTVRLEEVLDGQKWRATLETALDRVIQAGYAVAWFAVEGDFADPPDLFAPGAMGAGVYAAAAPAIGFLCGDDGVGDLRFLTDAELARVRAAAAPLWSVSGP